MPIPIKRRRSVWERAVRAGDLGVWMCGLCLNLTILMAVGLLILVCWNSIQFFWPHELLLLRLQDGQEALGIVWDEEEGRGTLALPEDRLQMKVGNRRTFGFDFRWISEGDISGRSHPPEAVTIERTEYGDMYGWLQSLERGDQVLAAEDRVWPELQGHLAITRELLDRTEALEDRMGVINRDVEALRLEGRELELSDRGSSEEHREIQQRMEAKNQAFEKLRLELEEVYRQAAAVSLKVRLTDDSVQDLPLSRVVRIYKPNSMGLLAKSGVYLSKWWEFLAGEPREANTEGGIFPAIFGTFFLVLLMSAAAVPLGVVAALYLGEYATDGYLVRAVRIAVQNLAGVPSIVFGVFGLGFFVYGVGGTIDALLFSERLPTPTFGTGGVLWASLTLALLTVPVVIVATEESLRAVPKAVREASYGLGATQWQTIRRVILPSALPGILTGLILAVARGAGEVAPLMITGVVKLAPALPVDGEFPYVHLERKFMHMAFHIYDVGFQSPNVEAAKPMVYMTTLLLLTLVVVLNLVAIRVRTHLREKYKGSAV